LPNPPGDPARYRPESGASGAYALATTPYRAYLDPLLGWCVMRRLVGMDLRIADGLGSGEAEIVVGALNESLRSGLLSRYRTGAPLPRLLPLLPGRWRRQAGRYEQQDGRAVLLLVDGRRAGWLLEVDGIRHGSGWPDVRQAKLGAAGFSVDTMTLPGEMQGSASPPPPSTTTPGPKSR